jgi:hypothetical protein
MQHYFYMFIVYSWSVDIIYVHKILFGAAGFVCQCVRESQLEMNC